MRGNHSAPYALRRDDRSIPACAGEPVRETWRTASNRVYPRVCGGTRLTVALRFSAAGLSPRVRGNLAPCLGDGGLCRSIPACAGEPPVSGMIYISKWVYPRVCGGICLVFNHEASHGNGLVYCHTAPDHRLEGPGPSREVTSP